MGVSKVVPREARPGAQRGKGLGSRGPWEARLRLPTHHPPGVLGRAHFFGVASDLWRQKGAGDSCWPAQGSYWRASRAGVA